MVQQIEVNLKYSPAGGGTRAFVLIEEQGRRTRLLYVPTLRAFWLDSQLLRNVTQLPLRGLATRIRSTRRERNLLGLSYSGPAVRQVLEALRDGRAATIEEEKDDALWGAREVDDEDIQPNNGETTMDTNTGGLAAALDPSKNAGGDAAIGSAKPPAAKKPAAQKAPAAKAAPAKGAVAKKGGVAALPDSKISGKPTPSPNAAPATAAAAPAGKKKPPTAAAVRTKWTGTEKIKPLSKENPSREGSRLFKLYSEITDGITVADLQTKMRSKHKVEEGVTTAMLRHMIGWGKVSVSAPK